MIRAVFAQNPKLPARPHVETHAEFDGLNALLQVHQAVSR
jgi:hypothetical protein